MVDGKKLSALLQILRNAGVTRYVCGDVTIELVAQAPAPARVTTAINVSPGALTEIDPDDDPGDFRFALERLTPRHYPAIKGDPRRNKAPE